MGLPFGAVYFGVILGLIALIIGPLLTIIPDKKDDSHKFDKVTAVKIDEKVLYGNDVNGSIATYEWEYNGVKHRIKMDNDAYGGTTLPHNMHWYGTDMPDKMEISVDRRTGKHKEPSQITIGKGAYTLLSILMLALFVIAYIIAAKITGVNPLMD